MNGHHGGRLVPDDRHARGARAALIVRGGDRDRIRAGLRVARRPEDFQGFRVKGGAFRQAERNEVYQRYLFAPQSKVEVSFDDGFAFKDGMYWDQKRHRYQGRFRFSRHFLGADNVPAFDGNETGEEFQCAQVIDSLPQVKYWLRNVARHPNSFWLPTATDKFYPDFVTMLTDGRLLVVEYKAEDPDSRVEPLHKMSEARIVAEISAQGFRLERVIDIVPSQHVFVFRKTEAD